MRESRGIRIQAGAVVGQQQRRRWLGVSCLLVVMGALVGGSAIAAAAEKASLKVAVPASVPAATTLTVTASGQAGKYNAVAAFNYGGPCPAKVPTRFNSKAVKSNHKFKVKLSIASANPGTHNACVYLYKSANPHGSDIHKSKPFQVT